MEKKSFLGITTGDLVRAIPIIFLCGVVYANQQNVNLQLMKSIEKIDTSSAKNAEAIGGLKELIQNLQNYLSSTTGKQFNNGFPR